VGYAVCKDAVTGVVQLPLKGDEPDYAEYMQRKRQMWSSPYYLLWLTTAVVYDVYGALLLQSGHLPLGLASSSSNSSSRSAAPAGGSSSSNRSYAPTLLNSFSQAWQLACSQLPLLPDSHTMLLQAVGCSSRVVLGVAALRLVDVRSRLPEAANAALKADATPSGRAASAHKDLRRTLELYMQWFHAGIPVPDEAEYRTST
jgi:hypothetical protein